MHDTKERLSFLWIFAFSITCMRTLLSCSLLLAREIPSSLSLLGL